MLKRGGSVLHCGDSVVKGTDDGFSHCFSMFVSTASALAGAVLAK